LKKTFEIPEKGVKVYSPDEGWSNSPVENSKPNIDLSETLASNNSSTITNKILNKKTLNNTAEVNSSTDTIPESTNPNNMVAVGDALEQLFDTLNNSSSVNSPDANPTWREVAELSRILEEKLDSRKDMLEKLSLIDEDLHSTRKELLLTLKKLGKFENEQLSAATIRASVSAMAIEVLAKKLT
jgi:hypothetical protein